MSSAQGGFYQSDTYKMQDDNEQKVGLWDGKEADSKPLRMPKINSTSVAMGLTDAETDAQEARLRLVRDSKLSADAKEWVPSPVSKPPSAQNRLKAIRQSSNEPDTEASDSGPNSDFLRLQNLVIGVTLDPGQFDEVVDTFRDIMIDYSNDEEMVRIVADFVFTQAVGEASFHYNGARLCAVLQPMCPTFEASLYKLCEQEIAYNRAQPGLTMFLAELYMQHPVYGQILYDSLRKLLQYGGDDNVKTVCQSLKLSGRSLETNNKGNMDLLFEKLEQSKGSVKNNIVNLIETVITLRQKNWGAAVTPSSSSEQNGCVPNWIPPTVEKPTFYGPDGNELSMDEQKFLAVQCGDKSYMYDSEYEDPDELFDPEPEMDEEIQAAFREFVKLNK